MKKIYKVKCECGKENELLNDYVYYFREYIKMEPRAQLVCSCGRPIKLGNIGKKRTDSDQTDTCPNCGSLLKVYRNGFYEEAECMGCGYTETSKLRQENQL